MDSTKAQHEEDEELVCPECGFESEKKDFEQDEKEESGSVWFAGLLLAVALLTGWAIDAGLIQPPV